MVPEAQERTEIHRPLAAKECCRDEPIPVLVALALDESERDQGIGQDADASTAYPGQLGQSLQCGRSERQLVE